MSKKIKVAMMVTILSALIIGCGQAGSSHTEENMDSTESKIGSQSAAGGSSLASELAESPDEAEETIDEDGSNEQPSGDEESTLEENGEKNDASKLLIGMWNAVYHSSVADELSIVIEDEQKVQYIAAREDYSGTYVYDDEKKELTMHFTEGKIYDNSTGEWRDAADTDINMEAMVIGERMVCRYVGSDVSDIELLKTDIDESAPIIVDDSVPNRRLNMYLSVFEEYGLRFFEPDSTDRVSLFSFIFAYHTYAYHSDEELSYTEKGAAIKEECVNEICEKFFGMEAPKESCQSEEYFNVTYEDGMYYFMVGDGGNIEIPVTLVNDIEKIGENEYRVKFDTVNVATEDYNTGEPNYYIYSTTDYVVPDHENIYYSRDYETVLKDPFVSNLGSGDAVVRQTENGLILVEYHFESIYD